MNGSRKGGRRARPPLLFSHVVAEAEEEQDAKDVEVQLELHREALVVALGGEAGEEGAGLEHDALRGVGGRPLHHLQLQRKEEAQDLPRSRTRRSRREEGWLSAEEQGSATDERFQTRATNEELEGGFKGREGRGGRRGEGVEAPGSAHPAAGRQLGRSPPRSWRAPDPTLRWSRGCLRVGVGSGPPTGPLMGCGGGETGSSRGGSVPMGGAWRRRRGGGGGC